MDINHKNIQNTVPGSNRGKPIAKPSHKSSDHFVGGLHTAPSMADSTRTFFWFLIDAFFATALCRAWNLIVFSTLWAVCITLICDRVHDLSVQPTLLTVYGTIVGFVISYRTSSSFERYNEGRRLWSTIILGTRTFARTVWFHIPDQPSADFIGDKDGYPARNLIEKRTVINLAEAFSVAVKHYLRGEYGILYQDLYHLVRFLPVHQLPAGIPPEEDPCANHNRDTDSPPPQGDDMDAEVDDVEYMHNKTSISTDLPLPVTAGIRSQSRRHTQRTYSTALSEKTKRNSVISYAQGVQSPELLPGFNPPRWSVWDIWPISSILGFTKNGGSLRGRTAPKRMFKHDHKADNIPLEITLYMSSYIASLQRRKAIDVPTTNTLLLGLNQLVDSLSGLERVLTTPIPFSYGVHLWSVCALYVFLMPFQIWQFLGYVTIPATAIAAFFFFGFLAAGEEIENPFGYDKNDLDLDFFCQNIIHAELVAITSLPVANIDEWVFSSSNDHIFGSSGAKGVSPQQWVERGESAMREKLKHEADEN